jgi:NAD+ kinase
MTAVTSILLVVHPEREEAAQLAEEACAWWERHGAEVRSVGEDIPTPLPGRSGRSCGAGDPGLLDQRYDFAISLGGDGTMLRAVRLACAGKTPVLGVNLGRMGYLTEVEPPGVEAAFARVAAHDYLVSERMMLAVSVGSPPAGGERLVALNEAVIEKVAPGHTIRFELAIGGRRFLTYAADGLIVSTPTGSTAYNLSVRGPIVSPSLRAVVVTPISPHMLFDRSLVLEPSEEVTIALAEGPPAALVLDGTTTLELASGQTVTCGAADQPARIVTFGARDFHAIVRAKFGLADR